MGVKVALIGAAKLEKVAAFQPRNIVAVHAVVAVPVAGASILVIGVVGPKYRARVGRAAVGSARVLAADFQGRGVTGNVRHAAGIRIGPPVAGKAEVEVVCNAGLNVFGETSGVHPRILGLGADGGILALG